MILRKMKWRRVACAAAILVVMGVAVLAIRSRAGADDTDGTKDAKSADDTTPAKVETAGGRSFLPIEFSIQSVRDGNWSDPQTWEPKRVPGAGDRVRVTRGTSVVYDVESTEVVRLVQVVGTLRFARDRDTLLSVGILKVQNSEACSEEGFACDLHDTNEHGEPFLRPVGDLPLLEVGTVDDPIPAGVRARIVLHYLDGMNRDDAPALACCSARMELHGAPMSRTWVELAADVEPGAREVLLDEEVTGWRVGDEVIVTGAKHTGSLGGRFRESPERLSTERRKIASIEGKQLMLDEPLAHEHYGTGRTRSEVANLSRSVVIASADPGGVRGHTIYHQHSRGSISYARFDSLGKENTLGRYPIHFHLVGDSMRGSSVLGVAIVDSHNRWITIHGTNYLLVRDCVGYRSVGHGFFMEDGTEVYNVLDRNLGVQAFRGRPLPKQVLPFDPNDGGAYWWANGRNTFIRNVACENDEYGYRYDSQRRSNFDSRLPVLMPDGTKQTVDIRTIPIFRFQDNETHTEGLYGVTVAGTDGVGPDTRHPHVLRDLNIWQVHYALRSQLPTMLIENVNIDHAVYGVYRPEFRDHVYRNLQIINTETEPFNRGIDDESLQNGSIAVDGLVFSGSRYGNPDSVPYIQMSDNNPTGKAETHIRGLELVDRHERDRRPLVGRGGGLVVEPTTPTSVPVYLHDYFGPGRTARIVSTHSGDYDASDGAYRADPPLTGPEARVAEVGSVEFPELLQPVDDLPPATAITRPAKGAVVEAPGGELIVRGFTTDNEKTRRVLVNGVEAKNVEFDFHRWEARLTDVQPGEVTITAIGEDEAGNVEQMPHQVTVSVR